MSTIKVINSVKLNAKGVLVKDADGKYVSLHKRQGDMDGACSIYSLAMALLCLGVVTEDDLNIYNKPDKRTSKGKFLSHFLEEQGLIRDGYYFSTLAKEINEQDFGVVATRMYRKNADDIIDIVADTLDEEKPVIVSTNFPVDCGHAMLAVGYETNDDEDTITKILCLDPSEEAPVFSSWNCVIDVSHKRRKSDYPFDNITKSQSYKVALGDILIIENKK